MDDELKKVKSDYAKLMSKHNKMLAKYKNIEIEIIKYKGLILGLIVGIISNILVALFS